MNGRGMWPEYPKSKGIVLPLLLAYHQSSKKFD
jgi:hypothetical protein